MKKLIVSLTLIFVISSSCYGAISEDVGVYVRKDVFEVYMQNLNSKMDTILEELKAQRKDINELTKSVAVLSKRMDGLEDRMGDLRNDFYLWLIILGIVLGLPFFGKLYEEHKEARKSSFTLDDVQELMKKLIEENNVKLERKFQV
ncbi:MAG: hypothetical protein IJP69_11775 [Synergistaceae bacterium]|nr:hypothetical protein [Synergistaceae bacterium]